MCGVFGVVLPPGGVSGTGAEAAQIASLGLFALQHRGQESAGIAVSDGDQLMLYKDLGLIASVLDEGRLPAPDEQDHGRGLWVDDEASGWVLSSETAGLDIVGAEYVRDVEPGEMVVLEPGHPPVSIRFANATPALCVFELIYFARPDS